MASTDADEDYEKLDLLDRLSHKLWKARVSAYEELSKAFKDADSESDPNLKQYSNDPSLLLRAAIDSNAIAQEKGVAMVADFLSAASPDAANRLLPLLLDSTPNLVDKGLGATRAGTKNKSIDILVILVQSLGSSDPVTTLLIPHTTKFAKQPKVLTAIVIALTRLVDAFGLKQDTCSDPRPVFQLLPTLFGHADKNVRAQTNALIDSIYVFFGEQVLSATLNAIKPVQANEIRQRWQDMESNSQGKGSRQPDTLTRIQQRNKDIQEAQGQLEGESSPQPSDDINGDDHGPKDDDNENMNSNMDPYDLIEPIEISSRMPQDFDSNLTSSKWKDRKELALEPLYNALDPAQEVIKVESRDGALIDHLANTLAQRIQTDANIMCVSLSAQIISRLAIGLRAGFARHAQTVIPPLIEKLKEKKPSVVECLANALDHTFESVQYDYPGGNPLTAILPFCIPALSHKNPNVKMETMNFIARSLAKLKNQFRLNESDDTKQLGPSLRTCLDDGAEMVRSAAVNALGVLRKLVPTAEAESLIKDVDEGKVTRIKEVQENTTVKAKPLKSAATSRPPPPPSSANKPSAGTSSSTPSAPKPKVVKKVVRPSPAASASTPEQPSAGPPKQTPAKPTLGKPPAGKSNGVQKKPAPGGAAAANMASGPAGPISGDIKYKFATNQEGADQARELLPQDALEEISSSNWKARLASIDAISEYLGVTQADSENIPGAASGESVENSGAIAEIDSEMLIRFLSLTPGWKESNFQVYAKSISIIHRLAIASPTFQRSTVALAAPPLADKFSDIKLKKPVGDTLTAFAERTSLGFVLSQVFEPILKQKAPKAQAEALIWLELVIREFGVSSVPLKDLIALLKTCLKSSNGMVRSNATKTLVTLKLFIGSDVKDFLSDLNSTLLSTIDKEFAAVDGETAPEPVRFSTEATKAAAAASSKSKNNNDQMEELFTRYELEKIVPSSLVKAANDTNWKARKEAMEKLQEILESHKRFKPGLGELGPVLKGRSGDSNKIVQGLALDAITRIASGMNKPFEKHVKSIAPPVLAVLADQKAVARTNAVTAITAICENAGLDTLIPSFEATLQQANPVQRKEVLTFLHSQIEPDPHKVAESMPGLDLSGLVVPTLSCLEDRNSDLRKAAQAFLPLLIGFVGYPSIMENVSELKPASKSTVTPLVEAARSSAPKLSKASSSASAAPSATPKPRPESVANRPPSAASQVNARTSIIGSKAGTTSQIKRPPKVGTKSSEAPAPSASSGIARPRAGAAPGSIPQPRGLTRSTNSNESAHVSPSLASNPTFEETDEEEVPLRTTDNKHKVLRATKEVGQYRWLITEGVVRPEQIEQLHHQMGPHVSSKLLGLLFSKDHHAERDFSQGLDIIHQCCIDTPDELMDRYGPDAQDMPRRIISNTDLIIKYITIRLTDSTTTLVLKVLDVLDALLSFLQELGQRLSDHEASCLLPTIVSKLGDQKEAIRARIRKIFKTLGGLYPYSKVFSNYVEHGLHSKNARTRMESAEDLANLIHRLGMSVCSQPQKSIPIIASLVSDRDSSVRNSALNVLSNIYTLIGDEIYSYTADIPEKSSSMLNERLKRSGTGANSSSSPTPSSPPNTGPPTSPPRSGIPRAGSAAGFAPGASKIAGPSGKRGGGGIPTSSSTSRIPGGSTGLRRPTSVMLQQQQQQQIASPSGLPKVASSSSSASSTRPPSVNSGAASASRFNQRYSVPEQVQTGTNSNIPAPNFKKHQSYPTSPGSQNSEVDRMIRDIYNEDPTNCVEALKTIQRELAKDPEILLPHADALINAINQQMKWAFEDLEPSTPPPTMRLCKHLLQTLSTFFDKREQGVHVSRDILLQLLAELSHRLLDTADRTDSETISGISKVLNMVLIRIFHHSDQGSCFGSLFTLLHQVTVDMRELQGEELAGRARYAELVMKCLWKVSKTVKQSLDDETLDPRILLSDIDNFLISIPPAEWRRRATDSIPLGDMPLRTVKTILQQVVSVYHNDVYDKLELIDRPENSFVYQYLYRLLNSSSARPVSTTASSTQQDGPAVPDEKGDNQHIQHQRFSSTTTYERSSTPDRQIDTPTLQHENIPMTTSVASSIAPAASTSSATTSSVAAPSTPGGANRISTASMSTPAQTAMTTPGGTKMSQDIEQNQRLKEIFEQIGNPRESKQGIAELYKFQKANASAEGRINNWISGTGVYFQNYIKRGLANHANEDADRHSVLMDSPREPLSPRQVEAASPLPERAPSVASGTSNMKRTNSVTSTSSELSRSRHTSTADDGEDRRKLTQLQAMFGYTEKKSNSEDS